MKLSNLTNAQISKLSWSKFFTLLNEVEKIEDVTHAGEYWDRWRIQSSAIYEYRPDQNAYVFHSRKTVYRNGFDFLINRDTDLEAGAADFD